MPDSPIAATPYEVLGVRPDAGTEELRRAYRRMLRETHPDTGGVAAEFHAVQDAWEQVGAAGDRADYDRGSGGAGGGVGQRRTTSESRDTWAPFASPNRRGTRPAPREYGIAGGWQRDAYLGLLTEWAPGSLADPYDPVVVRSAPGVIRRVLAKALAEEADGDSLSSLGIGFTIWHDVAAVGKNAGGGGNGGLGDGGIEKIDHVVLGASGLFAVSSNDWGGPVRTRKGELIGSVLGLDEHPVNALSLCARVVARTCRVPFTALVVVVPDGASDASVMPLASMRGVPVLIVQRSRLPDVLRTGLGTAPFRGGAEVFDVRTRLSAGVRFA